MRGGKRQTIQLELALEPEAKGEARSAGDQGTEARMACAGPEHPAAGRGPSMEAVVEPGNLKKALARVRRNRGAPSNSPTLSYALPNAFFARLGLASAMLSRLIPSNRRVRTRVHGGVGGVEPRGSPLSRLPAPRRNWAFTVRFGSSTCSLRSGMS